jgi:PAS domain S-box-containing protein
VDKRRKTTRDAAPRAAVRRPPAASVDVKHLGHELELYEQAPVNYLTLDPAGRILHANRSASALLGVERRRLLGKPLGAFLDPSCADAFHLFRRKVFVEGSRQSVELVVRRPHRDELRHVRLDAIIRAPRGPFVPIECIVVMTDLTELKSAEESIRRLNQELARRVADLSILSRGMISLQEEERRRIARELHDETGQAVSAVVAELCALEEATSDAVAKERMRQIRERVAGTLREIRRISQGLRPAILESCGLEPAIMRFVNEFAAAHGIAITAHVVGFDGRQLPPAVEINLYRIMQEALTNIARHAGAHRVSVFAVWQGKQVRLVIEDDGRGFDADRVRRGASEHGGFGLIGMRERVGIIDGDLRIESTPDKGTTIAVYIPVEQEHPCPSES